jgi:hypothetical protein
LLVLGGLVVFSAAIVAIELWLLERTAERVVLGVRRDLERQRIAIARAAAAPSDAAAAA